MDTSRQRLDEFRQLQTRRSVTRGGEADVKKDGFLAKTAKQLAVCAVIFLTVLATAKIDAPFCTSAAAAIKSTINYQIDYVETSKSLYAKITEILKKPNRQEAAENLSGEAVGADENDSASNTPTLGETVNPSEPVANAEGADDAQAD